MDGWEWGEQKWENYRKVTKLNILYNDKQHGSARYCDGTEFM